MIHVATHSSGSEVWLDETTGERRLTVRTSHLDLVGPPEVGWRSLADQAYWLGWFRWWRFRDPLDA